jgi:hypothetical protein
MDESPNLPDVGRLFADALEDLRQDLGGWLLAGLALTIVLYVAPILAMMGVVAVLAPIGFVRDGVVINVLGALTLPVAAIVAAFAIGPFLGSTYRAAGRRMRTGERMGFGSAFSSAGEDLGHTLLVTLVFGALVAAGGAMCVLPGLAVAWLLGFALPDVFLNRRRVGDALSNSVALVRRQPGWTLGVAALGLLIALIAGAIPIAGPIVGSALWIALHVRAYRAAFGDVAPAIDEHDVPPPIRRRVETYDVPSEPLTP